MNMVSIRSLAGRISVHPGRLIKTELIRLIQVSEGNFGCYCTGRHEECVQENCLWRKDCFASTVLGEEAPEKLS